jgi:hypothetical protein
MGAFIVAIIAFAITICVTVITFGAAAMSETGLDGPNPFIPLVTGTIISVLIAATHWLPHIGW